MSVHDDRYLIDGEYRQIMLSARELNSDRTWERREGRTLTVAGYQATAASAAASRNPPSSCTNP